MLKVLKFGGSSLASGETFEKVKKIVEADSSRSIVIVSATAENEKRLRAITTRSDFKKVIFFIIDKYFVNKFKKCFLTYKVT